LPPIESIPTHGEALFAAIAAHEVEGIVGKRLDASYRAGRQPSWVKIKNQQYSRREALQWRRSAKVYSEREKSPDALRKRHTGEGREQCWRRYV
jgi:ATP-dependent DNA ligase